MEKKGPRIAVLGAGAAGFFAALAAKEHNPQAHVVLVERTAKLLSKVRISGGGRCNVTHACFDPKALIQNYPRGNKELLGPFSRFQPKDTIDWFQKRGVRLKAEEDGRMFPTTDQSETIINCFLDEAKRLEVPIYTKVKVSDIHVKDAKFDLGIEDPFDRLILATGSSPIGWEMARHLGHSLVRSVPSLFTLNIKDFSLVEYSGISVPKATIRVQGTKLQQTGPLLITHWGFSGPAALKLSAFGANYFAENHYSAPISVNWISELSEAEFLNSVFSAPKKKTLGNIPDAPLPRNLWKHLCASFDTSIASLGKKAAITLYQKLTNDLYTLKGKTTNKDEFVTCGGIPLSEVDFKTMESKICPGLYFCGEVLNVDGVTGGFNFQNAWTTGWIAGRAASSWEK